LDAVANKVVAKYQSSTRQQLMQQKAQNKPPSAGEQKAMEMLKTDPQMRHEFVTIVADPVVDKLIQCGMIPCWPQGDGLGLLVHAQLSRVLDLDFGSMPSQSACVK
jgi:hypothetical protein